MVKKIQRKPSLIKNNGSVMKLIVCYSATVCTQIRDKCQFIIKTPKLKLKWVIITSLEKWLINLMLELSTRPVNKNKPLLLRILLIHWVKMVINLLVFRILISCQDLLKHNFKNLMNNKLEILEFNGSMFQTKKSL